MPILIALLTCLTLISSGLQLCFSDRGIRKPPRPTVLKPPPQPPYIPPLTWLTKRITTITGAPQDWQGTIPARPGDQIWEFSSLKELTEQLMGTGGRCLLRNGRIIDGVVTWST
jgi:hypothetical protein